MMFGFMIIKVEMYDVNVICISGDFSMGMIVFKVDKFEFMILENLKYEELMERYIYLRGVYMDDKDIKS